MIAWDVELEVDGEKQVYQTRQVDDEHHLLSFGSSPLADVVIAGAAPHWLVINDVGYTWLRDGANETRRLAVDEPFVLGASRVRMTKAPSCAAGTWRLKLSVVHRGYPEPQIHAFHKARIVVGRMSPQADLVLRNNASRKHCVLDVDDAGIVWIADLGSTNGTYVNGRRVPQRQRFELGDRLMVGDHIIQLAEPPRRVPK